MSGTSDSNLSDKDKEFQYALLKIVEEAEFEPQIFFKKGLALNKPWNFNEVLGIAQRCQGAIILGLPRWEIKTDKGIFPLPSEYNHYEGAIALSQGLPTLIMVGRETPERGIFFTGGGQVITHIPSGANPNWLTEDYFKLRFRAWRDEVNSRYEVFFGYSSAARATAHSIVNYLSNRLGVKVREYETGFQSGGTILEEIEKASQTCLCGIFLFTCDDTLADKQEQFSPRDNVIFEAGYFMKAKGKERTLIIREEGAKMPDDIGGNIYLHLKNRADISTIQANIQYFLENRL